MKNFRIEIKKDLFCIAKRLKKIDRHYKVFFNINTHNFEVWRKGNLSFLAGKSLDNLALIKAHKSNVRNARSIFFDVEQTNKKIEEKNCQRIKNKNKTFLGEVDFYASKKSCDIDFLEINKTKWF